MNEQLIYSVAFAAFIYVALVALIDPWDK